MRLADFLASCEVILYQQAVKAILSFIKLILKSVVIALNKFMSNIQPIVLETAKA
jgi:hypothetical protein